jgi:hypothetical protein
MKKLVISVVSAILLISMSAAIPASAGVLRASLYLDDYSAWAAATGGGQVRIDFDVTAVSLANSVGATQIVVQRKNGSSWTNVQTFNSSSTSGMLASNTLSHCGCVTYSGASGSEYRAVVTVYAKIGSGSDSKTVTTGSVTA